MLRCSHPSALQFRENLRTRIDRRLHDASFCLPFAFHDAITLCIDHWLYSTPLPSPSDPDDPIIPLLQAQAAISWDAFFRGFWSTEWYQYLLTLLVAGDYSTSGDFDRLFTSLISILWSSQVEFWHSYQRTRQSPSTESLLSATADVHSHAQHLLTLRDSVEYSVSDSYFPPDPDSFLQDSAPSIIRAYTDNYGPAILASMR